MRRALAAAALAFAALGAASCALRPAHPGAFAFAVMGDAPYSEEEEGYFAQMLERIDREPLAFVVHVGDFKGPGPCSDALFERRRAQFDASRHPFVFVPGDNEWADCPRQAQPMEALERLARLREVFFARDRTLGAATFEQEVQRACLEPAFAACGCGTYPENRTWTRAGVAFVTLNVTGSHNNRGFGTATDAEARCRDEANRRWLERAARQAEAAGALGMVILVQANPWWTGEFTGFVAQVEETARRLRRPVLLAHGDSHMYRVDFPFRDARGEPLPHLTRMETFGSPFVGWVRVTVDPGRPDLFTFEPVLQAVSWPGWMLR